MDCRILRSLTLKSDGHLCCDDSNGYDLHLGEVSSKSNWDIQRVLNGPLWSHIRRSFREGRVPWPGTCESCHLLSSGAQPLDTSDSSIELRIEPTLSCALRCPCCNRQREASRRMGSWFLDPALFKSLLESCARAGLEVPMIIYLGLGEPLDHPEFATLSDLATRIVPGALQELGTNGNHSFRETVGSARLDRIIVAGDGLWQKSYVKYRIRGSIEAALQFMRDAKQYAANAPFVEWKYILFEFNDTDQEIVEAQRMAEEIGVDSIMFIITDSKWHSKRFRPDNLNCLPLLSPIATISPAASLQKVQIVGQPAPGTSTMGQGKYASCFVDACHVLSSGVLRIEGWALGIDGSYLDKLDLYLNGFLACSGRPVHRRKDVPEVITYAAGPDCGFVFQYPLVMGSSLGIHGKGEVEVEVRAYVKTKVEVFSSNYTFASYVSPRMNMSPFGGESAGSSLAINSYFDPFPRKPGQTSSAPINPYLSQPASDGRYPQVSGDGIVHIRPLQPAIPLGTRVEGGASRTPSNACDPLRPITCDAAE